MNFDTHFGTEVIVDFNANEVVFLSNILSIPKFFKTCGLKAYAAEEKLEQDAQTEVAGALEVNSVLHVT